MVLFSQVVLVILTLLVPFVMTVSYTYIKDNGWRPVVFGILEMISTLVLVRLILPLIFIQSDWFVSLINNEALFNLVYSIVFALILTLLNWVAFRFHLQNNFLSSKAVVFGFEQGFAYEALFVGFIGLSSLLSSASADIDPAQIGGLWYALGEAVCILVLFAGMGAQFGQAMEKKTYIQLGACALEVFLLLYIGSCWYTLWKLPRWILMTFMIVAAILTAWWLKGRVDWSMLYKSEANEPQEDPEYLKELEEYEKERQARRAAKAKGEASASSQTSSSSSTPTGTASSNSGDSDSTANPAD